MLMMDSAQFPKSSNISSLGLSGLEGFNFSKITWLVAGKI